MNSTTPGEIPLERYADAVRAHLSRHPATDGFALVDASVDEGAVAVAFRWRRDPHVFVTHHGRDQVGIFDPGPGASAEEVIEGWVLDVRFWLMEELDTGLLVRAQRRRDGERIVVTEPPDALPAEGVYVCDVPQFAPVVRVPWRIRWRLMARLLRARLGGRRAGMGWAAWGGDLAEEPGDGPADGDHLADAGLDPARVRAIRDEGRLLAWLQADDDRSNRPMLGQCAVTRDPVDQAMATVEVLELATVVSTGVREALVDSAVRAAADAGARTVLVPTEDGGMDRIDTAGC